MSPDALIRTARRQAELTQAELGRRMGMTQAAVARLERRGANPTIKTLEKALNAAGHQLDMEASRRPPSVDDTLIASYLRMSPADRLRAFQSSHDSLARLRELAMADGDGATS